MQSQPNNSRRPPSHRHRTRPRTNIAGDPFAPRSTPSDPFATKSDAPPPRDPFHHNSTPATSFPAFGASTTAPFAQPFGGSAFALNTPPNFGPSSFTPFGVQQSAPAFGSTSFPSAFGSSSQFASFGPSTNPSASAQNTRPVFGAEQRNDPFNLPSRTGSDNDPFASSSNPPKDPFASATERGGQFAGAAFGASGNASGDPFASRAPPGDRPSRVLAKQLLIRSVPPSLFSDGALMSHFGSIPGVMPLGATLRGSLRGPEGKRTALVSFETPQEASIAMSRAKFYEGGTLNMSYYKGSSQAGAASGGDRMDTQRPPPPPVPESKELVFSYVPEDLFSEDAVRNLFNSISGNEVVGVSVRSRPHRGGVKRTAIVTFSGIAAAKSAMQNLPSYNGEKLHVNFRSKPPSGDLGHARRPASGVGSSLVQEVGMASADGQFGDQGNGTDAEVQDVDTEREQGDDEEAVNDEQSDAEAARMAEIKQLRKDIEKKEREVERMKKQGPVKVKGRGNRSKNGGESGQSGSVHRRRSSEEAKRSFSKTVVSKETENATGWRTNGGKKVDINEAVQFVGTCQTMCPEKEFGDRILQRDVSIFESIDGKGGEPDFSKAVKKYRRSAAISEEPSPEEVRPPPVLLRTMEYLSSICDLEDATFADIHNFVRDRTRSLRQDLTYQGVRDDVCIEIHEKSVRFHILSEHRLTGVDPTVFSSKQNREQLDKCLISLRELYDLRREQKLPTSPNEPEMQAYHILMQMSEPQTCVQLFAGFSEDVRNSFPVQFALKVLKASSDSFMNYVRYFACVQMAPYLMACLMHSRFHKVRCEALDIINSTHGNPTSRDTTTISTLTNRLGFESDEATIEFCSTAGFDIIDVEGSTGALPDKAILTPSPDVDFDRCRELMPQRPNALIEKKTGGMLTSKIIGGGLKDGLDFPQKDGSISPLLEEDRLKRAPTLAPKFGISVPPAAVDPSESITKIIQTSSPAYFSAAHAGQGSGNGFHQSILDRLGSGTAKSSPSPMFTAPSKSDSSMKKMMVSNISQPTPLNPSSSEPKPSSTARTGMPLSQPVVELKPTPASFEKPLDSQLPRSRKRVTFDDHVSNRAEESACTKNFSAPTLNTDTHNLFTLKSPKSKTSTLKGPNSKQVVEERTAPKSPRGTPRSKEVNSAAVRLKILEAERAREQAAAIRRQREKEIERTRQISTREKERLDRHERFVKLAEEVSNEIDVMEQRLERVQRCFESISIEESGREKVHEACRDAEATFEGVAKELRESLTKMEVCLPDTENGKKLRDSLINKLNEVRHHGKQVWRAVWRMKGAVIVTPLHASLSPKAQNTDEFSALKHSALKRKAINSSYVIKEGSGAHREFGDAKDGRMKAAKMRRTVTRPHLEEELLVGEMWRQGMVRLEVSVIGCTFRSEDNRTRTLMWLWGRLNRTLEHGQATVKIATKDRYITMNHFTYGEGQAKSAPNGNVLIFCVDISSQEELRRDFERVVEILSSKRRERWSGRGTGTPFVILLLCANNDVYEGRGIGAEADVVKKFGQELGVRELACGAYSVEIGKKTVRFGEASEDLCAGLKQAVMGSMKEMERVGTAVHSCQVGERAVEMGTAAWVMYVGSGEHEVTGKGTFEGVINAVNVAWLTLLRQMEEDEKRWPEEMRSEVEVLRNLRIRVSERLRLPVVSEMKAADAMDYISNIARMANVASPNMDELEGMSVALFCRSLGHLMTPFVSMTLSEDYFARVYLPDPKWESQECKSLYWLGHHLGAMECTGMTPSKVIDRAWDGSAVGMEPVALSGVERVGRRTWCGAGRTKGAVMTKKIAGVGKGMEGNGKARMGRASLEFLRRKLEFTPRARRRRHSAPGAGKTAREVYWLYDELCEVEMAHQGMLDATIEMIWREGF